jgi:hypothetical protein
MSIVSLESADEKNVSASILNFLTAYGVISLLSKCGGTKLKGVPVKALFTYTLTNVFRMGSFYMQNKLGKIHDGFSKNTYYRFLMARQKATSVMVDLLKTALAAGHKAKYVLFDSWFSNPQQMLDIKKLGLNTIAMVKRSSKRFYIFEGKSMDIKKIFATSKKRRGRSRYLLSVTVKVGQDKNGENGIDARIVCVRNRNNRKDWIAIICTDMSLSENDIIRIYGHRWDIEVFFKTCKSSLLLRKEYHGVSYDGLTAHVAMVFTRYMLLAVSKRDNEDDRTLGELFYIMISEVADITYHESMQIIVEAMLATVQEEFHIADAQVETFYAKFMSKLPESMQRLLQAA